MSIHTSKRVWAHSKHSGTELLMMLAIADFADDQGNAYPAVGTLAERCRMSTRNVNHILAALRASGELEIRQNEGPKGTNRYRITLADQGLKRTSPPRPSKPLKPASPPGPEAGFTPEARVTLKPVAGTPEAGSPKPLKPASDEPSLNRQELNTRARRAPHDSSAVALLPEVDAQVLRDWEAVRKAKRVGAVTATVAKTMRAEAAKAGLSVQSAIELCCARGWAGFNASWDRGDGAAKGRSGAMNASPSDDEIWATVR
jgi:hypothetical protein